jgi:hypothetical protein
MSNLTHLQGRNTKVKFTSRILEQIYVGSETGFGAGSETNRKVGSGSRSEKNHSRSTALGITSKTNNKIVNLILLTNDF